MLAQSQFQYKLHCYKVSVVFVLAVCSIEFPMILRDSLEVLFLNDNQLECVPQSVCGLHSLTELYLSKWVCPLHMSLNRFKKTIEYIKL